MRGVLDRAALINSLSGKWGKLAPEDEQAGKLDKSKVMLGFLVPAGE